MTDCATTPSGSCTAPSSTGSAPAASPACSPGWSGAAAWSGRRASAPPDLDRPGRRRPDDRPPVPGRLQHQDVHRRAGDGSCATRAGSRLDDTLDTFVPEVTQPGLTDPAVPGARVRDAARAARRRLGDAGQPRPRRAGQRLQRRPSGCTAPHQLWHYSNLVFSMLGEVVARLDAPALGRVAAGPDPRPAGDAADHGRVRRPARAGLLRAAVHRRARRRSTQLDLRALDPCGGLASTGADLARWSAFVADPVAEVLAPDDARGDVRAADRDGPRALDRRDGPRLLPGPLRHPHVRRPHRRHARPHHRACSPTGRPRPAAWC